MIDEALLFGPFLNLFVLFVVVISFWELAWKGIALWNASKNGQPVWFVFLLILNTAGILPILYLLFFQKKRQILVNRSSKKRRR